LPTDILQEIGSYAGLAAIVGLAVLSALYFSQARDVKRLREWAGRAPERSAERQPTAPPATGAGRVVAQPQQPRAVPVPGRPAAASATGAAPASAVAAGGATEEHDALSEDTGERELVEAGSDNGDTGDREPVTAGDTSESDALYETGEHELSQDGDTGDEAAVDAEAAEGEAEEDERFAPPEGEPAVAAAASGDDRSEPESLEDAAAESDADEDAEADREADEAEEREPVGAQARAQAAPGLAPSTAAGGMAAGAPARPAPGSPADGAPARPAPGGPARGEPVRPAPQLPARPMPHRTGSPPPLPRGRGTAGGRAGQTAIIPPPARGPWYRRLARHPRYLVLVIAGVLIVGGGAAFGVTQLTKEDTGGGGPPPAGDSGGDRASGGGGSAGGGGGRKPAPVEPSTVTVAVLNGTTVPGLAAQMGDKISGFGFQLGNITNSTDQEQGRAESAVLYAPGHQREAVAVARKLNISQREQIDAETQAVAGDATVVVITGIDQTR
jgi:LytR cell envelope-related transcriptional attenuator